MRLGLDDEEAHKLLNTLFERYNPFPGQVQLYANDTIANGRFNVAEGWKVRDWLKREESTQLRGFKHNGDLGESKRWQLGSATHRAVLGLLKGALPYSKFHLPLFDPIDEKYLADLASSLEQFQWAFEDKQVAREKYSTHLAQIRKLYDELQKVYQGNVSSLSKLVETKAGFIAFLSALSWGRLAINYFQERQKYPLFDEIIIPEVSLDEGLSYSPGKADGIWIESIDGKPPTAQQTDLLSELCLDGSWNFTRMMVVFRNYFSGKNLSLGILEVKCLGDNFLRVQDVVDKPRKADWNQVMRYATFAEVAAKNYGLDLSVDLVEILHVLPSKTITYLQTLQPSEKDIFQSNFYSQLPESLVKARIREAESYTLKQIHRLLVNTRVKQLASAGQVRTAEELLMVLDTLPGFEESLSTFPS